MSETRRYLLERVDDAAVVQVYADGFTALSLREKTLAWHLAWQGGEDMRELTVAQIREYMLAAGDVTCGAV